MEWDGWRASSGHIYGYILFLTQLNYATERNITLNGKGFGALNQLEYGKQCEFEKKKMHFSTFHFFFFLSIAFVLFSFCEEVGDINCIPEINSPSIPPGVLSRALHILTCVYLFFQIHMFIQTCLGLFHLEGSDIILVLYALTPCTHMVSIWLDTVFI